MPPVRQVPPTNRTSGSLGFGLKRSMRFRSSSLHPPPRVPSGADAAPAALPLHDSGGGALCRQRSCFLRNATLLRASCPNPVPFSQNPHAHSVGWQMQLHACSDAPACAAARAIVQVFRAWRHLECRHSRFKMPDTCSCRLSGHDSCCVTLTCVTPARLGARQPTDK